MTSIYVLLNNVWVQVEHLIPSINGNEQLSDSLETISFSFDSKLKDNYPVETPVKVIHDGTEIYYIISMVIEPTLISKSPLRYRHSVVAIEPTKYLEKVNSPSNAYTNKSNTLLQQVEKALINAEVIRNGITPRFKLSQRLRDFITGVLGQDFYFTTPNLREVFDGMLAVKNSRVKVNKIIDYNDIELDYIDLNSTINSLRELDHSLSEGESHDIEYLAGSIEAYTQNSLSSDKYTVTQDFNVFKPRTGSTLTSDNAMLLYDYPVEAIELFVIKCRVRKEFGAWHKNVSTGVIYWESSSASITYLDINLTKYLIEQELYDLLDEATLLNQYNFDKSLAIPFTRGSTEIDILKKTNKIFFNPLNIKEATKAELAALDGPIVLEEPIYRYFSYFDWQDSMYATIYVPYIDMHIKVDKKNYKGKTSMYDNQSDKAIDIIKYGGNLEGKINRLGNKVLVNETIVKSYSDLRPLGEVIRDGYVLVDRSYNITNNNIEVKYTFSKDYNNINERIGISRKKEFYSIPLEYIERDLLIKKYIYISTAQFDDTYRINRMFLQGFLNTLVNGTGIPSTVYQAAGYLYPKVNYVGDRITKVLVTTIDKNNKQYGPYQISILSYGSNNSLLFQFKFQDNYSVNNSVGKRLFGGRKIVLNPYVDVNGEYKTLYFGLSTYNVTFTGESASEESYHEQKLAEARKLPLIDYQVFPVSNEENLTTNRLPIFLSDTIKTEHDRSVRDSITAQFDSVSLTDDIVIGENLIRFNRLINTVPKTVRIYGSTRKYKNGDNYATITTELAEGSITAQQNQFAIFIVYKRAIEPGEVSWVFADADGKLYLACNNIDITNFYISMSNERKD